MARCGAYFGIALVLLACAGAVHQVPTGPDSLTRFWNATTRPPTTMHLYIYRQMEECVGFTGEPFETLRWISADFILCGADYQRLGGLWISGERMIVLANQRWGDPVVVSEELLHSLLGGGDADHDNPDFQRCVIKRLD